MQHERTREMTSCFYSCNSWDYLCDECDEGGAKTCYVGAGKPFYVVGGDVDGAIEGGGVF